MRQFDLVILGGGSGAFAAAIKARELDQSVALIERDRLGGTCVNRGCVPSKNLLKAGEDFYYHRGAHFPGIRHGEGRFNFEEVMAQKRQIVQKEQKGKYADVISHLGITYIPGMGRFVSDREIEVNGERVAGRKFIIATGAKPAIPPIEGIEAVDVLTSATALELESPPESMVILGGGYVGLEFAQMYHRFGSRVILLEMKPRILAEHEESISERLTQYLREEGIEIITGANVTRVQPRGKMKIITAEIDGKERTFEGEALLVGVGISPNSREIGLERAGVEVTQKGYIQVDDEMRTTNENIYAVGDVASKIALETVAASQGSMAAENALTGSHHTFDYLSVPRAVFTHPEVASVGLTEKKAEEMGIECSCRGLEFKVVPKADLIHETKGYIKMVIEAKSERVIGVHILASGAADLIHAAVMAVKFKHTIRDIRSTLFVFPTLSESIKLVAQSFTKDVANLSCCIE
ncbi:MAG: mercury(II) reductase (plasmid) [Candidatus Manganitrophus sp.]|nr:mercury(II) reductase [Candidatus Manganitrophus sp.]MDC4228265.1 mercury(II) reductase [Candidatus Manganitrophus sp.]WDT73479.1 MAG: mercury(II) reductase [Candidatus Manganitrophus sp.]